MVTYCVWNDRRASNKHLTTLGYSPQTFSSLFPLVSFAKKWCLIDSSLLVCQSQRNIFICSEYISPHCGMRAFHISILSGPAANGKNTLDKVRLWVIRLSVFLLAFRVISDQCWSVFSLRTKDAYHQLQHLAPSSTRYELSFLKNIGCSLFSQHKSAYVS